MKITEMEYDTNKDTLKTDWRLHFKIYQNLHFYSIINRRITVHWYT